MEENFEQSNQQTTQPPPLTSLPNSEKVNSMNKTYLLIAVVIIFSTVLIYLAYQNLITTPRYTTPSQQKIQISSSPQPSNDYTAQLPIALSSKFADTIRADYHINAQIAQINKKADGTLEITTDIKDPNVPKLNVNAKTPVSFLKNGVTTKASITDLKASQKIGYIFSYGLRSKTSYIAKIDIVQNDLTPTPAKAK